MNTEQHEPQNLDQFIILTIKSNRPSTVEQLVRLAQAKYLMPEQKIIERILHLQDQGKIVFETYPSPLSPTIRSYLLSTKSNWYWAILALSIATAVLTFSVPENAYPAVYARYVLGCVFVLLLPGYSFIKAVFPARELDNAELVALSIGMSLALVPIVGLLLNYTPWGIRTTSVTLSLLTITIVFATTAIIRDTKQN